MTVDLRSTTDQQVPIVLLYCPYDRRTTRHARRASDSAIVCTECGRGVDLGTKATAGPSIERREFTPPRPSVIPGVYRGPHVASVRVEPRRPTTPWLFGIVVGTGAALIGLLLAVSTLSHRDQPVAPSPAYQPAGDQSQYGAPLVVANTDGIGVFVRRTPSLEDKLHAWPDGTALTAIGPPTVTGGIEWRLVRDPSGTEGWIPSQYTRIADQP